MRNFFYAAAGVCLLALAFHLGSTMARAQTGTRIIDMANSNRYGMTALDDAGRVGDLYSNSSTPLFTVPGAIAIAGDDYGGAQLYVACSNGDIYQFYYGQLVYKKNILSGAPVPATQNSWSQVKSRYRQDR